MNAAKITWSHDVTFTLALIRWFTGNKVSCHSTERKQNWITILICKIFHLTNLREAFTPGGSKMRCEAYLPGTGDTLINKGVLPGRGLSIALRWADPCDRLKCRWLGCVISWWGGLRSRYPLHNQLMESLQLKGEEGQKKLPHFPLTASEIRQYWH